jgi:hypothetical protein
MAIGLEVRRTQFGCLVLRACFICIANVGMKVRQSSEKHQIGAKKQRCRIHGLLRLWKADVGNSDRQAYSQVGYWCLVRFGADRSRMEHVGAC